MNYIFIALFVLVMIMILTKKENYRGTYAGSLDDEYVSTRNDVRTSDFFHLCSPQSPEECKR